MKNIELQHLVYTVPHTVLYREESAMMVKENYTEGASKLEFQSQHRSGLPKNLRLFQKLGIDQETISEST